MSILKKFPTITLLFLAMVLVSGPDQKITAQTNQEVSNEEEVKAEDLEVGKPRLLPGHPLYRIKEGWRGISRIFTFNPVAKLELEEKFSSEKLIELKELANKKANPELLKEASENYEKQTETLKERALKLKEKAEQSPRLQSFLDKYTKQQILHQQILQKLQDQVPAEVLEKIKAQREKHLERFKEVMLKLQDEKEIPERLERALDKIRDSQVQDFKSLEILKEIEERMPEQVKEKIKEIEAKRLEKLEKRLDKATPEQMEKLKNYLETMPQNKERQLEILESLKMRMEQKPEVREKLEAAREKVLEKLQAETNKDCPLLTPPAPNFCQEGRIIPEKNEQGCVVSYRCLIPAEREKEIRPLPTEIWPTTPEQPKIPSQTGEVPESRKVCLALWDPVCGKDAKTYSNKCFARLAQIEIDHPGVCQEKENSFLKELP